MASALSAGASAAIKYSIAILGRAPTEAELNSFAAAYKGASATASEDAVAAAVVASTAGASALRPGVFSATKQAQVILGNHGVTNDAVVAYVASMIDGTNADAGKVALPLGTVARVVANFFSSWTSTPSNPYNDVFMAGSTALKTASTAAESAILNPVAPTPVTPSYALSAAASVDEGKSTVVTLTTKNVASGDVVNYLISGVDAADVNSLTGSATVGSDGKAYITIAATADATTEGAETMTVTAGGATASIVINDKSLTPAVKANLTAGIDTTIVGGALDDSFSAVATGTASTTTLNNGDQLSGGEGTDTLSITSTAAAGLGDGVISSGIEVLSLTATGGDMTVNATGFSGLTTVANSGSTANVTVSNLKAVPALNVTSTSANTTIGVAAAAVVGDADAVTINLSGVGTAAASNPTVSVNDVETINVSTSGASSGATNSTVTIAGGANLGTLNVTGSAAAKLAVTLGGATTTKTGTVTSDAGAHDIAVTVTGGTSKLSVAMGGGDDTVRLTTSPGLLTGSTTVGAFTIDGGEGVDTLVAGNATTAITVGSTTTPATITNFEKVTIAGGSTVTLSTTSNTAVSAVSFDALGGTLTGLAAGATVTQSAGGTATVANSAWTATTSTADSLSVTVGSASAAGITSAQGLTATGIETATITNLALAGDVTTARSVGVTGANLSKLTVTGAQPTTITGGGTALTTVDASGVSAAVTINASATGSLGLATAGGAITSGGGNDAITGSSGADTINSGNGDDNITAGAGSDVISAGAGNDVIDAGSGADSIDGGDGNDTITLGTGADTVSGGGGTDTFIIGANTTVDSFSTATAPDVITDFTVGTDKLSVSQTLSKFNGNYASLSLGLVNMTANDQAFYVTTEQQLYVIATKNTYAVTDTVIKLSNVAALSTTGNDFTTFGSQGVGNTITTTAATAPVISNTASNAASSVKTTPQDDAITASAATALVGTGAAIDGGAGLDSLTATVALASLSTLDLTTAGSIGTGDVSGGVALTSIETVTLNISDTAGGLLTVTNVPTSVTTVNVGGTNPGVAATFTATGQTMSVTNATVSGTSSTITFGAFASQVATTGEGADTFNTIAIDGINITANGGNDTFNVTNLDAFDDDGKMITISGGGGTDSIVFANALTGTVNLADDTDVLISSVETLNVGTAGKSTTSITAQTLGVTLPAGTGFRTLAGTTTATVDTNSNASFDAGDSGAANITFTMTAAQLDAITTVISGASGGTFTVAVSAPTADVSVNLADTDFVAVAAGVSTIANTDSITFAAVPTTLKANVTIDENLVVVGGAGSSDTLTIIADLGAAATVAASNFETVAFTTVAQTGATVPDTATAVTTNIGGVYTLGTGGDTFTNSSSVATTVTGGAGNDTFAHSGTGALTVNVSGGTDTVNATGTGALTVFAKASTIANVNLNASNAAVDRVYLTDAAGATGAGITAATARVTVTGFNSSGDLIYLDGTQTSANTGAAANAIVQIISSAPTSGVTFSSGTADLLLFNFDLGGSAEVLAGDLTGASLMANLGQAITTGSAHTGYVAAFDNGKLYIYYGDSGTGSTDLAGSEMALVAVVNAEVGTIGSADLIIGGI